MKKIFVLLLTSLIINACSSDDDSNNSSELSNSNYKLTRVEQFDSNNNLFQDLTYTYDTSLRLIEATDNNISFYYNYSNNKLISISNSNNITINNYTYNDNLVSIVSNNSIRTEMYYNDLNQLIRTSTYDIQTNELMEDILNTFDDEDNLINSSDEMNNEYDYLYDNKNNPSSLLFNNLFLKSMRIGSNNVTEKRISNDLDYLETREYTYNNENFPITEKIYINSSLNKTIVYSYETL
jgi:YD repeat-containing protein